MRDVDEFAREFVERLGDGRFSKARFYDEEFASSDEFVEAEVIEFERLLTPLCFEKLWF